MPTLRRVCNYPACTQAAEPGRNYCGPHRAAIDARRAQDDGAGEKRQSATARGYGRRWRKIRFAYLAANPVCVGQVNGAPCGRPAEEVDHIKPLADGGTHDIENLQALCKSCHSRKTIEENRGKSGKIEARE